MEEPKEKMYWWRWRQNSSAMIGKWRYSWTSCTTIEELHDYLEDIGWLNTHSEHYRGIDAKKVSKPPKKVLQDLIEERQRRSIDVLEELEMLTILKERWGY